MLENNTETTHCVGRGDKALRKASAGIWELGFEMLPALSRPLGQLAQTVCTNNGWSRTLSSFCKSGTSVAVAVAGSPGECVGLRFSHHWGKDELLNKCSCDKWVVTWQKIKLDSYLTPHTRINTNGSHHTQWIRESQVNKRKQTSIKRKPG